MTRTTGLAGRSAPIADFLPAGGVQPGMPRQQAPRAGRHSGTSTIEAVDAFLRLSTDVYNGATA